MKSFIYVILILLSFTFCKKKNKSVPTTKKNKGNVTVTTPPKRNVSNQNTTKNEPACIDKILQYAKSQIGTPYKYGGTDSKGFDCSGLTSQSYNNAGIKIPRTAGDQANQGKPVSIDALNKGDLVFFTNQKGGSKITHVGLVTLVSPTSVKFIHASTSRGVVENELLTGYYRNLFVKAVRYVE